MADSEVFDFSYKQVRVQWRRKGGINPYRLGLELLEDVRYRWDTGRHGQIWDSCQYMVIKEDWDRFVLWKNYPDQWPEVMAFEQALKDGRLGFPKEMFSRSKKALKKYLVTTWLRYQKAEEEDRAWQKRLAEMRPYEEMARERAHDLSDLEFNWARQEVYQEADRRDLWLWTVSEIEAELRGLRPLLEFKRLCQAGQVDLIDEPIPEEWRSHHDRFSRASDFGGG